MPDTYGGPNSGNHGHAGRPGQVGGSGGGQTGLGKVLGLSERHQKEFEEITTSLISKLEGYLNEGSPTCTVAANEVGKFLEGKMDSVQYVSGDFQEQGHWWVVVGNKQLNGFYSRIVVDFGDNISKSAIEFGKITPKIMPLPDAKKLGYKAEDYMNRKNFVKEM